MSVNNFLTVQEVAKKLRVSERSVMRYIKAGKLIASKMGQWRIKEDDLEQFFKVNNPSSKAQSVQYPEGKFAALNEISVANNKQSSGHDVKLKPVLVLWKFFQVLNIFRYKKTLSRSLALILIISLFGVVTRPAVAVTDIVFPSYCLGGWGNPQLASGKPDLDKDSDPASFNKDNSAVAENILGEMFCGYFNSEFKTNQPSKVEIEFNWYIKFENQNIPEKGSSDSPSSFLDIFIREARAEELPTESVEKSETVGTTEPVNQSEVVTPADANQQKEIPAVSSIPISDGENQEEATSTTEQVKKDNGIPSLDENASSGASHPDLQNALSIDSTTTSLINPPLPLPEMSEGLENQSIPENKTFPEDGFAEISYSFDGKNWVLLQRVNPNNWRHFSAAIPVSSWDELNRLQIAVKTLPYIDSAPTIYLDGMYARVEYEQTFTEAASDVVSAVSEPIANVIENVSDTTANIFDAVTNLFENEPNSEQGPDQNMAASVVQPEVLPEKEKIKERKFLFTADRQGVAAQKTLPWYSRDDLRELTIEENTKSEVTNVPILDISSDKKSLDISGSCKSKYFVILLFKNPEDYKDYPNLAIYNSAYPCKDGKLNFNLNRISADIPDSDYYLLIAEQNENTPWVPASQIIPLRIGSTIEEIEK